MENDKCKMEDTRDVFHFAFIIYHFAFVTYRPLGVGRSDHVFGAILLSCSIYE